MVLVTTLNLMEIGKWTKKKLSTGMHEAKLSRKQIQERESLVRSLSLRKSSYSWLEHEIKESLSDQALVSETQASSFQGTAAEQ